MKPRRGRGGFRGGRGGRGRGGMIRSTAGRVVCYNCGGNYILRASIDGHHDRYSHYGIIFLNLFFLLLYLPL